MLNNPYTPGAGCLPPYIAGRQDIIYETENALRRMQDGYPQRSFIIYGLRGVGKTVLLNYLESASDNLGIMYEHIEASESGLFMPRFIGAVRKFMRDASVAESAKSLLQRCKNALRSFELTYSPSEQEFSVGVNQDVQRTSGVLEDDMTELLVQLGKLAHQSHLAICFFIDEAQFLDCKYLKGITSALHRLNQLRLPIMFFCAGLPKLIAEVSRASSYAERLFRYVMIGKLTQNEACEAIIIPAQQLGVTIRDDAANHIASVTDGYPYFIQEYCSYIWDGLPEDTKTINVRDARGAEQGFIGELDRGFFESRYMRCSRSEMEFMQAMASCDALPCEISYVAGKMGKDVRQVSTTRAQLISKGMIYPPERGKLDFTVPLFERYLHRVHH